MTITDIEKPAASDAAKPSPQTLTGGEALAASLINGGVDTLFAIPGIQLDGFFNAVWDRRDELRVIHPRHEQTTAYMADGYARVTGREGVCVVVPGPGLLNAAAGLSTAYSANVPVLCVTGQIHSDQIGKEQGALHEIKDQLTMIRSVTKHAERAETVSDIPGVVGRAFEQLRTGRARPVEIEAAPDVLFASGEVDPLPEYPARVRSAGDPDLIEQAARALGAAVSPVIFAGGGIERSEAGKELEELASLLQAPVIVSHNGRGALSDRSPYAQSTLAEDEYLPSADVILLVGTRFCEFRPRPDRIPAGKTVIQLDIDPVEIGRNTPVTIGIEADAQAGLAALVDRVAALQRIRPSREDEFRASKARNDALFRSVNPQADLALAIRAEVPDDGVIVSEFTQVGYWSFAALPVYQPNTFLTPGYQGTLGYGFPTAIGAKVGKPDVPVVSINGDGGFGFGMAELATIVKHDIHLITIVFNDNAYGNVLRLQRDDFGGRVIGSELFNPDYQLLARAYGITGRYAETADQLRVALRESIRADEPTLIEVPVGPMPDPWKVLELR